MFVVITLCEPIHNKVKPTWITEQSVAGMLRKVHGQFNTLKRQLTCLCPAAVIELRVRACLNMELRSFCGKALDIAAFGQFHGYDFYYIYR